jgi:hypothetical protein
VPAVSQSCSFIRFRRAPVPTLMILLANSTPMVCDERTRHSLLTNRWRRHDLSRRCRQPYVPLHAVMDFETSPRNPSRRVIEALAETVQTRVSNDGTCRQSLLETYFPDPLGPRRMILAK